MVEYLIRIYTKEYKLECTVEQIFLKALTIAEMIFKDEKVEKIEIYSIKIATMNQDTNLVKTLTKKEQDNEI
jgi:hypothetical protein